LPWASVDGCPFAGDALNTASLADILRSESLEFLPWSDFDMEKFTTTRRARLPAIMTFRFCSCSAVCCRSFVIVVVVAM